ncbi:MAG: TPM domain-containing protein, partial [Chitinophagaceae bacterium]|nr:TPM domain-containing protein [Chitinophagaceae bacterium]
MFSFFRKRSSSLFSAEEKEAIAAAIVQAEKQTSGEIRVFIENKCRYIEATDRAAEL